MLLRILGLPHFKYKCVLYSIGDWLLDSLTDMTAWPLTFVMTARLPEELSFLDCLDCHDHLTAIKAWKLDCHQSSTAITAWLPSQLDYHDTFATWQLWQLLAAWLLWQLESLAAWLLWQLDCLDSLHIECLDSLTALTACLPWQLDCLDCLDSMTALTAWLHWQLDCLKSLTTLTAWLP